MTAHEQLSRQLEFIDWSCRGYDAGRCAEAVRIALALRVLFHHTQRSHSLIAQLGVGTSLHLHSTFRERHPNEKEHGLVLSFDGIISLDGVAPPHGESGHCRSLPFSEWWKEDVHTFQRDFSRQEIILSAANQDGGAHVDPSPSRTTQVLRDGIGTFSTRKGSDSVLQSLDNIHFLLLRQFGYEVLNSAELLALARTQPDVPAP